jgi:hypothetical protein
MLGCEGIVKKKKPLLVKGGLRALRSIFEEAHEQLQKGGGIPSEKFWGQVEQSRRTGRSNSSRGKRDE